MLGRYGLQTGEKQQWARSMTRDLGRAGLADRKRSSSLFFQADIFTSKPSCSGGAKSYGSGSRRCVDFDLGKRDTGHSLPETRKAYDVEVKTVSGSVDTSLFEDAHRAGIQPALLSQLADIFTWTLISRRKFIKAIRTRFFTNNAAAKGQETKSALRILAAELINAGQKLTAVYFEKQEGRETTIPRRAQPGALFLRFPLEFNQHYIAFHGLAIPSDFKDEFAAYRSISRPAGHSCRAVRRRRGINDAGWNGSYGKAIEIKTTQLYEPVCPSRQLRGGHPIPA